MDRLGLSEFAPAVKCDAEVVQRVSNVEMVITEQLAPHVQRFTQQSFTLGGPCPNLGIVINEHSKGVERTRYVKMLAPQELLTNRQRLAKQRFRLAMPALTPKHFT